MHITKLRNILSDGSSTYDVVIETKTDDGDASDAKVEIPCVSWDFAQSLVSLLKGVTVAQVGTTSYTKNPYGIPADKWLE